MSKLAELIGSLPSLGVHSDLPRRLRSALKRAFMVFAGGVLATQCRNVKTDFAKIGRIGEGTYGETGRRAGALKSSGRNLAELLLPYLPLSMPKPGR